jgi:hypothetical protein
MERSIQVANGPGGPVDATVASTARVYNCVLGGKDCFQVDREAAERIVGLVPDVQVLAVANYRWAARVARLCVRAGIGQVVDVGMGIPVSLPSSPSVYEAVRAENPAALVVGVDNDPVVLLHGEVLRPAGELVRIVAGDVRQPQKILDDLSGVVDFDRPALLILASLLHFVTDAEDPGGIVRVLTEGLAPGSRVAISHATSTGVPAGVIAGLEEIYRDATSPGVARTEQEIEALFGGAGLVLDDPGPASDGGRLVDVQQWRPEVFEPRTSLRMVCGVGRVPGPSAVPDTLPYPPDLGPSSLSGGEQSVLGVSVPGRAYAAIGGREFERACGLPAAWAVARGRGVSWVYERLTCGQAAALAERLEERGRAHTRPGSPPGDLAAGRACRDAAVKIRGLLAERGGAADA